MLVGNNEVIGPERMGKFMLRFASISGDKGYLIFLVGACVMQHVRLPNPAELAHEPGAKWRCLWKIFRLMF